MKQPSALEISVAQFEDLQHRLGLLDMVKRGLGGLLDKGVGLTSKDVTAEAGRLVAGGLKPEAMASLMSQMPDKPEALQAWVQHYADITDQREEQLKVAMVSARHSMGVAGVATLAGLASSLASGRQQLPAQAPETTTTGGGDLGPTASPSAPAPAGGGAGSNVLGI